MDLGIDGNAALVTASSSGLGKAAATSLAAEGVNVVINGRDEDRLQAAAEDIREVATGEVVTHPGTIVTITSKSVKEAIDALVLSNAVRMSVIGLEKTLSTELAPDIRVNAVLPADIETARIEELYSDAVDRGEYENYEQAIESAAESIPVGRLGEPRDLGDVVAFLSSPRSGFVNGAAVPIDGGTSASNL